MPRPIPAPVAAASGRPRTAGRGGGGPGPVCGYAEQAALTVRQIWYAVLSDKMLVKEERTYKHLVEVLGMARRSGRTPWRRSAATR